MDQPNRRGLALHRAGQTPAEWLRRKLQRQAPQRVPERGFATLAEARAIIERWRIDYNHVRPHSAPGGLTPEAARLNPAAVRLRNLISSAARPLPPATQISYQTPGLS